VNGNISIFLSAGFLADGMSLFESPELLFTAAKAPLAAREGNLRVLFMPKNMDDQVSNAEEKQPPVSVEAESKVVESAEAVPV
jgi:hypothetical protein